MLLQLISNKQGIEKWRTFMLRVIITFLLSTSIVYGQSLILDDGNEIKEVANSIERFVIGSSSQGASLKLIGYNQLLLDPPARTCTIKFSSFDEAVSMMKFIKHEISRIDKVFCLIEDSYDFNSKEVTTENIYFQVLNSRAK